MAQKSDNCHLCDGVCDGEKCHECNQITCDDHLNYSKKYLGAVCDTCRFGKCPKCQNAMYFKIAGTRICLQCNIADACHECFKCHKKYMFAYRCSKCKRYFCTSCSTGHSHY